MMFPNFSDEWMVLATYLANHLWQSTLFLLAAWAITLPLRHHQARARYWLWLVASVKFLVPFALFVDLGVSLGARLGLFASASQASAAALSGFSLAVDYVSQPFAPVARSMQAPTNLPAVQGHPILLPLVAGVLAAVWLCGFVAVVAVWCVRWRRIAAVARQAVSLQEGRELAILRGLEAAGGVRQPIEAVISSAALEPGIFGIFGPVLIWPRGISAHLDDEHIRAILAHELCHVRRRDNLAAAAHMLVEAIFWFHPLVWWMGKRMVEERERACDEQALELGNEPHVYAESILKTCEFCTGSPLACVSGVTGADLKERIVRIMANRGTRMLDRRRKLLLGIAATLAIAVPLAFGLTHAAQQATTSDVSAANLPNAKFEVASIRPVPQQDVRRVMMHMMYSRGRFSATNFTLKMLLSMAYNVEFEQIVGGPKWLNSDRFDIEAKIDPAMSAELKKLPPEKATLLREEMLQNLLAERFHLKVEHPTKKMPVYALVVTKHGPRIHPPRPADTAKGQKEEFPGTSMGMQKDGELFLRVTQTKLDELAQILSQQVHRTVVNKTGLTGKYDFTLTWAPGIGNGPIMAGPETPAGESGNGPGAGVGPTPPPETSGPSLFTALQDQLGLKLKSEKGPVQVLNVVNATQPTAN